MLPEDTESVSYRKPGAVVPGGTVTVTATTAEGYQLADLEGWDVSADRETATKTIELDDIDCPEPLQEVIPTDPGVMQASCDDGDVVNPSVILPEDTIAVTYSKSGDEVPGGVVTITATIQEGYTFDEAAGWTISDDGTTSTKTVELDDVDCTGPEPSEPGGNGGNGDHGGGTGPTEPTGPTGPTGSTAQNAGQPSQAALANTGVPEGTWWIVTGGVVLLLTGAAMMLAVRTRSHRS